MAKATAIALLGLLFLFRRPMLRNPRISLGILLGALGGFCLGVFLAAYGMPGWVVPVETVAGAVITAPMVKEYLDRLLG